MGYRQQADQTEPRQGTARREQPAGSMEPSPVDVRQA